MMARLLPVILSLTLICAESMSAQIVPWYMRGSKKQEAVPKAQQEAVPKAGQEEVPATGQEPDNQPVLSHTDTLGTGDGSAGIALVMPFKPDSVLNTPALDFYCGALLAARDFGTTYNEIKLTAIDSKELKASSLKEAEAIIAPFGRNEVRKVLASSPGSATVISALDPEEDKSDTSGRLLQIPAFPGWRTCALADWFSGDGRSGRELIVLSEAGASDDAFASALFKRLYENGTRYTRTADTALVATRFNEQDSLSILIASESGTYIEESIRAISALALRHYNIRTFCSAKARSYETLNVDFLHRCNVHLCSSYSIDYGRDEVKKFVLTYRALFNCEPGQYAFHGYDVTRFVADCISEYGDDWAKRLPGISWRGLQTGFQFSKDTETGRIRNTAVIKTEYCKDWSVRIHQ